LLGTFHRSPGKVRPIPSPSTDFKHCSIVRPAVAEALSKLKVETGSNQTLLQFVDDGIVVAGLPVLVSDQVGEDTVFWGIPQAP
jgi:hypothetical protein